MDKKFKILIDIDGTITHAPEFFSELTQRFAPIAEIHIVTARNIEEDNRRDCETEKYLKSNNIHFDHLVFASEKALYCVKNGINIVFEDVDEYFKELPDSILVFKIRETHNYDWKTRRWIYDDRTGVHIEDIPMGEN